MEGVWRLRNVGITEENKLFLVEIPNRNKKTLKHTILDHLRLGSIIITDCWKEYCNLNKYYENRVVNNSENYANLENGTITNIIEGTWNSLKVNLPSRNRTIKIKNISILLYGGD